MLGASSFVVVMTDYSRSALTCTCQDTGLLGLYVHRRSCTVLQRQPQMDQQLLDEVLSCIIWTFLDYASTHSISMKALKVMEDQESLSSHDLDHLDIIDQENCIYGGRPLTINVNNISNSLNLWCTFILLLWKKYENRCILIEIVHCLSKSFYIFLVSQNFV